MTLEDDWNRVTTAFKKLRRASAYPGAFLFADIEDLRKADNKGIDFAIRRLKASPEYRDRIRLYGGPSGSYPRYPLRCHDTYWGMRHYILIGIPELITRGWK